MSIHGLIDSNGNAIIDQFGQWLVVGEASRYRLLKDHYFNGNYIRAGEIVNDSDGIIPQAWTPTADVDPLNNDAVQAFYTAGPILPGIINSQWQNAVIARPVTYWYQVSPNRWGLTGLGSNQSLYPPKLAFLGRIE